MPRIPPPGKSTATRHSARVVIEERDTGVRHIVNISAPRTFFGLWRVSQAKPRRAARVRVGCGRDGRIKFVWDKGAKDVRTQRAFVAAVNQALRWMSRADKRSFGRVCRIGAAS
jgi:hypothetical protein